MGGFCMDAAEQGGAIFPRERTNRRVDGGVSNILGDLQCAEQVGQP